MTVSDPIIIEDNNGNRLFTGHPYTHEINKAGETYNLHVNCTSYSLILDSDKHKQSFQDGDMIHEEMLKEVYKKYDSAEVLFRKKKQIEIQAPVFEYFETDWNFTKRIAASLNTIVYPNYLSNSAQIYVGENDFVKELIIKYYLKGIKQRNTGRINEKMIK